MYSLISSNCNLSKYNSSKIRFVEIHKKIFDRTQFDQKQLDKLYFRQKIFSTSKAAKIYEITQTEEALLDIMATIRFINITTTNILKHPNKISPNFSVKG